MNHNDLFGRMAEIRRRLHQFPELSGCEKQTSEWISSLLSQQGIQHRTGVGGFGIVAVIPGRLDSPLVALRADIDALPVQEKTGLPFASRNSGIMHACGHDGHTAVLLGAAGLLLRSPPPPLPVRLLFQPAEEIGKGARAMIADGALEGVAAVFGAHLDNRYPAGSLVVAEGPVNASTDEFRILLRGRGGHAARPHEGVDAVVAAAELVLALQQIVSRELNPAAAAVVTVGRFQAGTAPNVLAGEAILEGTIRTLDSGVRSQVHAAFERIAQAIGPLHRVSVEAGIREGTPVLENRPEMLSWCREAAQEVVGEQRILPLRSLNLGGEDFAFYLQQVPGAFVRLGAGRSDGKNLPAHSSGFDFDESSLEVGARYFARLAQLAGSRLTGNGIPRS